MRGRVSRQQRATGYCMSLHREVTDGLLRPPSEDESEAPPVSALEQNLGRKGGFLDFHRPCSANSRFAALSKLSTKNWYVSLDGLNIIKPVIVRASACTHTPV